MKRFPVASLVLASAATLVSAAAPADLEATLRLASGYAEAYGERLALVLATERYQQTITDDSRARDRGGRRGEKRALVSDVIWVPSDQEVALLFYRDVYSVDAKPVRDRGQRLLPLFTRGPRERGREKAKQVLDESARFNVGDAYWNVNFPTLALSVLHLRSRDRFRFRLEGEATLHGRRVVEIEFREHAHPTLAQSATGKDYAASGSLWVARDDGALVKSELRYESLPGRIRVSYRLEPRIGMFVPDEMREEFGGRSTLQRIEGTARYTEYRRGDAEIGPILYR